jgi:hypothetical protein
VYREEAINNPPNHYSASLFFETHPPSQNSKRENKNDSGKMVKV